MRRRARTRPVDRPARIKGSTIHGQRVGETAPCLKAAIPWEDGLCPDLSSLACLSPVQNLARGRGRHQLQERLLLCPLLQIDPIFPAHRQVLIRTSYYQWGRLHISSRSTQRRLMGGLVLSGLGELRLTKGYTNYRLLWNDAGRVVITAAAAADDNDIEKRRTATAAFVNGLMAEGSCSRPRRACLASPLPLFSWAPLRTARKKRGGFFGPQASFSRRLPPVSHLGLVPCPQHNPSESVWGAFSWTPSSRGATPDQRHHRKL
ncbi:hypothetical protein F5X68DRAFT_70239 [Plectosphaerella plurivora]|uniref:Uncharacterized protein n=1 Tax=Plectosphaerella plurivora TaxID=936078 RepID=A0A9P9AET7_9PEZI|nr:hypothetical protein F5X68DRAFT_70239 [Plectosphaerella plurivora]